MNPAETKVSSKSIFKSRADSKNPDRYGWGVILILVSAITFSSAGLFTKGVEASAWEVTFWRALFGGIFTILWIFSRKTFKDNFFKMGYSGVAIAIIGAIGTAAFIQSFKLTTIANVSLIYAVSPLIAAFLAWVFIKERISIRTMLGCIGALIGVVIIVFGSLGKLNLYGDLLALVMTVVMASIMVIYRKYPDTPAAGPAVLSSILLLPFMAYFGTPLEISHSEIMILSIFGLLFAIASVCLAQGAKFVPASQAALLSSLETPLAPVFAFLLFAEIPNLQTVIGGALIMFVILMSIKKES